MVESKGWDPAVASLVAFPEVVVTLGEKTDYVKNLGDAFLAQPEDVMNSVQRLRAAAQKAGNLASNEQIKVTVDATPPLQQAAVAPSTTTVVQAPPVTQTIIIEPAQPQVVYVPQYNPAVVYGTWWWPSYPPYYYPPPPGYWWSPVGGAVARGIAWGAGFAVGNALWGGANWGRGDVDINVNRYNNINVNNRISNNNNTFVHNANRRGDVPYRDAKSREQFGKKQLAGADDRQQFRGKEGRPDARDADRARAQEAMKQRGVDPAAGRDRAQAGGRDPDRAAGGRDLDRSGAGAGPREAGARDMNRSAGPSHAMSGVRDTGASRASMDRGQSSVQSMNRGGGGASASRPAPSARPAAGGGGARAGGGGAGRAGGGGGGRGR
jgi:hypothetical protein